MPIRPFRQLTTAWLAASALAAVVTAQDHPRTPHRHPEGEGLTNPAPGSAESAREGREIYAKTCANCHGPYGLGNGRLAAGMAAYGARPSDLTDAEWQHGSSDGEMFLVIRDGVGPEFHMPGYQGKLTDAEIWHVVNHIRTLGM